MKERKNLEHLFQERFENFEILPPENVWDGIKIKLEEKENKKRVIPFWWKFSGIAAALVIGLFLLNTNFNDVKPADKIITNSEDSKPSDKNKSGSDDLKNTKNSVTISDESDLSNSNKQENNSGVDKTIAVSEEINPSNAVLKPTITPSPNNNKVFVRTLKSTITVADNNSEKTNRNKQKSTTTLNKNNTSDKSMNNNNAVADNNSDSEKSSGNKQKSNTLTNKNNISDKNLNTVAENDSDNSNSEKSENKVSKTQKNKINKSEIAVNSEKEKKENSFYNYENNKVTVAGKSEKNQILSDKKANDFNKKEYFPALKSDEKSSDKSFAETNSDKNANENSILNIGNKNAAAKNNSNTFNLDFDKNIVVNTKENELKLAEENKIDSTKIAMVEPNALEELLKEKEGEIVKKEPKLNRWQVTTNVAPIYFSSTGNNGSALDSKFANNSKSYTTNYSYGVGVNYKVAKKFKFRTGVNSVSFNYDTNDVVFYQSNVTSKIKNIATNDKGAYLEIENKNKIPDATTPIETEFQLNKFNGSLNQKLGYIEVPVEMSYTVLDKKFKIEILGGLSTLFLNQNEVYLESSGLKVDIGEATNLNDVHFSGNIGLGFKYGFLKNLEAKVEPVFKYQMNTYTTDTGDFKPYFIGVYTGLTYNF